MEDFLFWLVDFFNSPLFLISFITSWLFWHLRWQRQISRDANDLIQHIESKLIKLEVEFDKGIYFCYNAKNNEFVCQGADLKEIISRFKIRHPEKHAIIVSNDQTVILNLQQQWNQISNEDSTG